MVSSWKTPAVTLPFTVTVELVGVLVELLPLVYEIGMPNRMREVPWPIPVAVALGVLVSAARVAFNSLWITSPVLMVSVALLVRVVVAEAPGTAMAA
jgi:hypothetical protein